MRETRHSKYLETFAVIFSHSLIQKLFCPRFCYINNQSWNNSCLKILSLPWFFKRKSLTLVLAMLFCLRTVLIMLITCLALSIKTSFSSRWKENCSILFKNESKLSHTLRPELEGSKWPFGNIEFRVLLLRRDGAWDQQYRHNKHGAIQHLSGLGGWRAVKI